MILRKKIVKIVVVFLVLAALASILRFFYLIEPFDNDEYCLDDKSQWYKVLNQLMQDKNYTYEVEVENKNYFYKISRNVKKKIKEYVTGLTKYITYSDFCEYVGNNILNTGEWGWSSSIEYADLSDKQKKKSKNKC